MRGLRTMAIAALLGTLIVGPRDAPATIEEQRARLPPPAECSSPMAGRWRSLAFSYSEDEWYEFTLEIHEDGPDGSVLTGTIYVDDWVGPQVTPEPPVPCVRRNKGKMIGRGTFTNGVVRFGGSDYERTEVVCGKPMVGYNPDQFTGKLDPARQEFQALNNDGGLMVNEPTVFRRIGCFDDARKDPGSDVKPPPFFPKHTSGC
ncbi:MAG TPA: hypothetical protein VMJ10_03105 [Kofleriaceae bacterium]|nr:hypothetical protein [Kofleriaceae bacterium]